MHLNRFVFAAVLILGAMATVSARLPRSPAAATGARASAPRLPSLCRVDVNQLPVNLSRLQRRLRASAEREQRDGLNRKDFFIEVYAMAPPLVLLTKEEALDIRPVPSSAPTHQDMLRMLTPRGLTPPPTGRHPLTRVLGS